MISSSLVILVIILAVLAHAPWMKFQQQVHDRKDGNAMMLDFMVKEYEKFIEKSPLPPLVRYRARDGHDLGIRMYKPHANAPIKTTECNHPNIILHHGSALDSASFHPLATKLQAFGIAVFVPDIRGHGESIPLGEGELAYMWQNLDDLEDLLQHFKLDSSCTVIAGHSAQGGGVWHLASQPKWRHRFAGFVPIASMMGLHPEFMAGGGLAASNFVATNLPRIISISIFNMVGITLFNNQQTTRFYKKLGAGGVDDYDRHCSYNLGMSHAPMFALDYKRVLRNIPEGATQVLSISAGADEALADQTPLLQPLSPHLEHVTLVGATHIGVLFEDELAYQIKNFVGKIVH